MPKTVDVIRTEIELREEIVEYLCTSSKCYTNDKQECKKNEITTFDVNEVISRINNGEVITFEENTKLHINVSIFKVDKCYAILLSSA